MKLRSVCCALLLSVAAIVSLYALQGQGRGSPGQTIGDPQGTRSQEDGARLPNGKLQRDEILKSEHEQNLKDAAQLVELSEQLKEELEKNDRYVLSLASVKKMDDIEKLVK